MVDTHGHEVLDDVHVWQGVDLADLAGVGVDLVEAGQRVAPVDVHRTRAADTCK